MRTRTRASQPRSQATRTAGGPDLPFDQIATHEDALVIPFRRGQRSGPKFHAGVFDADGAALPEVEMRTLYHSTMPTIEVRDAALPRADRLEGTWLYCGIASGQVGHIVTRSMGMLWAAQTLPEDAKLLFVSMLYPQNDHPFLTRLLEHAGISNSYHIARYPVRVEQLVTAPDLFSEASEGVARPEFVTWARENIVPKYDKRRKRKLYLTRGRLSPCVGRYLNEELLETLLEQAGYEIVAPETLSLAEQFKLYAEADTIVASEGSALHLVGLALRPSATLVVIQRRPEVPVLIENQIASSCEADVHYIDAIDRVFWPQERADNVSLVRLDFEKLRDALVSCGALAATTQWRTPNDREERLSLHAGRPETERFLSEAERVSFLRNLRRQRRARRQARLAG